MTTHLLYGPTPYNRKVWSGRRGRTLKWGWSATLNGETPRHTRLWCRLSDGDDEMRTPQVTAVTCAQCLVLLDAALERGDVEVTGDLPRVRYVRPLTVADYRRAAMPLEFRRVP